jgi:ABC-type Na+ efflux pump permease subunit
VGKIFVIAGKDIKEALRSRSTYFYVLILVIISLPYFSGFNNVIKSLSEQSQSSDQLRFAIQSFLSGIVYTLPLVLNMLFCSFLSAYAVIMEKAKRTLESLLSTPLSLGQVWLGKSLAVALPGVIISMLVLIVALLVLNFFFIKPIVGSFILPGTVSLVTGFIILPVMVFFVVLIVSFLQLIMANPRIGNFAYIALFLLIYMTTITEVTARWDFSMTFLVATAILVIATLFLARLLKKERVVLSSKE